MGDPSWFAKDNPPEGRLVQTELRLAPARCHRMDVRHAESTMSADELARHQRMHQRFVVGSTLFAAHALLILLLLYYFFA
jgi:hypothetical protein